MTQVCLDAYPTHPNFPSVREMKIGSTNTIASIVANTRNASGITKTRKASMIEKIIDSVVWIAMFAGAFTMALFFMVVIYQIIERWIKR